MSGYRVLSNNSATRRRLLLARPAPLRARAAWPRARRLPGRPYELHGASGFGNTAIERTFRAGYRHQFAGRICRGSGSDSEDDPLPSVTALFRYPLKGARGLEVSELALDEIGPAGDRRWMAVDPDGSLITQREVARLCQVAAEPVEAGLRLSAPGTPALTAPLATDADRVVRVRVWNDWCDAADQGDAAAEWLSRWLERRCRLVYLPDWSRRIVDQTYDSELARVGFADAFPILLASEASLAALNARLAEALPMNRFRPNVVVGGTRPFEEDEWRRFTMGGLRFDAVKPCARCQVPTIDQVTGSASREPLRALATFRKRGSSVLFGMNVIHRDRGTVRMGNEVRVETTGPAPIVDTAPASPL